MRLISTLFALLLLAAPAAAEPYRAYAERRVAQLPEGAQFRDDLEAVLDAAASAYRRSKGRKGLEASDALETAARAQALDMLAKGKLSHFSARGDKIEVRFKAFQPDPEARFSFGENTAMDQRRGAADAAKAKRLFQLWVESRGHRRNLLEGRFAYVSSGVVQRGNDLWAVQIFWSEPKAGGGLFQ